MTNENNNGFISSLLLKAASWGLSFEYAIWEAPVAQLLLLAREDAFQASKSPTIQLSLAEAIDEGQLKKQA